MLIPPLTQLPVFVGSSMFLARLSQAPNSAFDSEAFLTLTSLAHPDPTAALPIALGMITLANVESSRWFVSAVVREREDAERERVAEQRAQGRIVLEPRKIVQSGLRLLSVGRILIGAVVPGVRATLPLLIVISLPFIVLVLRKTRQSDICIGSFLPMLTPYADFGEGGLFLILIFFSFQSVVLYWVSSATFGLLQTWLFDYWDRRKSNPRSLASTSRQSVPQSGPTATRDKATQALASVSRQKRR
jgi:hypothetical protein